MGSLLKEFITNKKRKYSIGQFIDYFINKKQIIVLNNAKKQSAENLTFKNETDYINALLKIVSFVLRSIVEKNNTIKNRYQQIEKHKNRSRQKNNKNNEQQKQINKIKLLQIKLGLYIQTKISEFLLKKILPQLQAQQILSCFPYLMKSKCKQIRNQLLKQLIQLCSNQERKKHYYECLRNGFEKVEHQQIQIFTKSFYQQSIGRKVIQNTNLQQIIMEAQMTQKQNFIGKDSSQKQKNETSMNCKVKKVAM